jgi:hypothetical protein
MPLFPRNASYHFVWHSSGRCGAQFGAQVGHSFEEEIMGRPASSTRRTVIEECEIVKVTDAASLGHDRISLHSLGNFTACLIERPAVRVVLLCGSEWWVQDDAKLRAPERPGRVLVSCAASDLRDLCLPRRSASGWDG